MTCLVEHPVAVLGKFDEKYLALPPEVLITCTRKKQKYFAVFDSHDRLTNYFIAIRNGTSEHNDVVREGFERVLAARLADAEFFFKQDTRTPLAAKTERLKGVMFQQKLGSMHDKTGRMKHLASYLASFVPAEGSSLDGPGLDRACELAKADLVTDMVFEYPELQGVIGRIYAATDGEAPGIPASIEEHYLPLTVSGNLPATRAGIILSLADKFDTLAGDFAVGMAPTGSADPYGLLRAAAG